MSLLHFEIGILMLAAFLAGFIGVWALTGNTKQNQ